MIYIMTHKKFDVPTTENHRPVLLGAYNKDDTWGYISDATGDNISEKNSSYCELTGAYWIWKNTTDEYKGLVHYRRFFSCSLKKDELISDAEIKKILQKYDIILPYLRRIKKTVEEQYCESGYLKDLDVLRDCVSQKYPEYLDAYDQVMHSHRICYFNMMIAPKSIYDDYCQWLFDILFEAEKRIDISEYDSYKARIYGFMSERLLNVYVAHKKMKVYRTGVVISHKWSIAKLIYTGLKRKLYYYWQMYIKRN